MAANLHCLSLQRYERIVKSREMTSPRERPCTLPTKCFNAQGNNSSAAQLPLIRAHATSRYYRSIRTVKLPSAIAFSMLVWSHSHGLSSFFTH